MDVSVAGVCVCVGYRAFAGKALPQHPPHTTDPQTTHLHRRRTQTWCRKYDDCKQRTSGKG